MRVLRTLFLLTTTAIPTTVLAQTAPAAPAASDAAPPATEEIIVTAQRREQVLQDVPLAVTAVTAEQLTNRNVRTLQDFSAGSVPGIRVSPFAGSSTTLQISSRGIAPPDVTQATQELAVPVYIDGVPLGRGQGLGLELIDPERVEFLRGPQGQLFGRNAEGGAIQFVSRRPSGKLAVDARLMGGNYGQNSERLRVDLPEFANIRLQASIIHTQHDGFTRNSDTVIYPGKQKDYNELNSFGYRLAAEWSPTDKLRLNYTYDYANIDDTQGYLVWLPVDINGRPPRSPQPAFNGEFPDRTNSPTYNPGFTTGASGHGLTIQYGLSDAITLKSITSFRKSSRHGTGGLGDALVAGGSSTGILTTSAQEDVDQKQTYQELQFLGSWNNFEITVGGTYFNESVQDGRRSFITGPGLNLPGLGISPAGLAGCRGLLVCQTARSQQNAQSDSYGVYAQATYTAFDHLELTAGIRYSDDKKVAQRTYIQPLAAPPLAETLPSGTLPPIGIFSAKRWDPAFIVKYKFSPDLNVYFRYATAYRAGGVNVRSSTFLPYGAEEVEAFEAGVKGDFLDKRLTFSLAAFINNIKNQQTTIQEQPTTNPSLTNTLNSAGTFRVKGIELEAGLRLTSDLRLSGSYSYTEAPDHIDIDNPLTVGVTDLTRFFSVEVPKHSGSIAADYSHDVGVGKLRFHLDYAYASKHHITTAGQLVASFGPNYVRPQAVTSIMSGRLALADLHIGPSKAEVALFGKNLLDATNITFGFDGAASGGGFGANIQAPRTFGAEFRLQF